MKINNARYVMFTHLLMTYLTPYIILGAFIDGIFTYYNSPNGEIRLFTQTLSASIELIVYVRWRWKEYNKCSTETCSTRAWYLILIAVFFAMTSQLIFTTGDHQMDMLSHGWMTLAILLSVLTVETKQAIWFSAVYSFIYVFSTYIALHDVLDSSGNDYFHIYEQIEPYAVKQNLSESVLAFVMGISAVVCAYVVRSFIQKILDQLEEEARFHRHYSKSADIAAQELLQSLDRLNNIAIHGNVGLFEYDYEQKIFTEDNDVFREIYDLPKDEYPILTLENVLERRIDPLSNNYEEDYNKLFEYLTSSIDSGFEEGYRVYHRNGERLNINRISKIIRDEDGNPIKLVGSLYDVTNEYDKNEELRTLANRDMLSGLYSRRGFYEYINENNNKEGWIFAIDMDYFKSVNDTYGHDAGDIVIKDLGTILFSFAVRYGGVAARMGGEEFILFIPIQDDIKHWEEIECLGSILLTSIEAHKFNIMNGQVLEDRTASAGISRYDSDITIDNAVTMADHALQYSKDNGRNQCTIANQDFIQTLKLLGADITTDELRQAILNDEIFYVAQPIVKHFESHCTKIMGFELLMRWKRNGEFINPEYFASRVDNICLRDGSNYRDHLLKQQRNIIEVIAKYYPEAYVSINLPIDRFAYPGSGREIIKRKQKLIAGLITSDRLVLEIIEAQEMNRYSEITLRKEMDYVKSTGMRIALDDFGKDSSNLKRLTEMPVDIIKFDKSFVDSLVDMDYGTAIVKTIGAVALLARRMDIKTVAEGVESPLQTKILDSMKIDYQQGYLHGKPMDIRSIVQLNEEENSNKNKEKT